MNATIANDTVNRNAKKGLTALVFHLLAVLCLLGALGAFLTKWSSESDLRPYLEEGQVSRARVVSAEVQDNRIEWNTGETGTVSYNFVHVVHDPAGSVPFAEFEAGGESANLPAPPAEATDDTTRVLAVSDDSFETIKPDEDLLIVTHRYDSSGAKLLSEITGRDYTLQYALMALFAAIAVVLWIVGNRIRRS